MQSTRRYWLGTPSQAPIHLTSLSSDEVLLDLHCINFKKIVPHDWKKLHSMWKQINGDYKAALSHFTMLGTHSSNFFDFCEGCPETYYDNIWRLNQIWLEL